MKPWWQIKHGWWLEDFKDWYKTRHEFVLLLRKHPDDEMGKIFRELIKTVDWKLAQLRREYKKIYGTLPNTRRIKEDAVKYLNY